MATKLLILLMMLTVTLAFTILGESEARMGGKDVEGGEEQPWLGDLEEGEKEEMKADDDGSDIGEDDVDEEEMESIFEEGNLGEQEKVGEMRSDEEMGETDVDEEQELPWLAEEDLEEREREMRADDGGSEKEEDDEDDFVDEDDQKYTLRHVHRLHLACHAINSSVVSQLHARHALSSYTGIGNSQHKPVATMRPTERIVNDNYEGKLCVRLVHRESGDYPKPLHRFDVKIVFLHSRSLYVKRYEELNIPSRVEERAKEFRALLKKKGVTDADFSNIHIMTYLPDLYEIGFEQTKE